MSELATFTGQQTRRNVMKKRIVTAAVALTLLLAGCSATAEGTTADTGKTPAATAPTPTPTPTPTADSEFGESETNSHGYLVKAFGQLAGQSLSEADPTIVSRFTVTGAQLDPACTTSFAEPAVNGHYLSIQMNVETTPELAKAAYPVVAFTSYQWQVYDSAGVRLNDPVGNSWTCFEAGQQLPSTIGPGQSVSGFIVLDVADTAGTIALVNGLRGWEWTYPG